MTARAARLRTLADRTPVLVGVGQWMGRDGDPSEIPDPLSILEAAARRAADDSGLGPKLWDELDRIAVPMILSARLRNPAHQLAARLGSRPRSEIRSTIGGNMPQRLLNETAQAILAGRSDVALIAGAEAQYSADRARRAGIALDWPTSQQQERIVVGDRRPGSNEAELAHGLSLPPFVYPLFDNALRAKRGWTFEEHQARLGRLCSRLTAIAAENPYAWFPKWRSADEIAEVSAENRMIAFPYTKFMNAAPKVDQGAAVILMSLARARAFQVPEERLVYWWGGGEAVEEPWFVSERPRFDTSPALGRAAHTALAAAGVGVEEIDLFDLYSCFPCSVQIACAELGIGEDDPRPLSVTGGLPYAGGPWNNYSTHAVAALVQKLRTMPGAKGLVTGVGWYLTRHSAGVYASCPPQSSREPSRARDAATRERALGNPPAFGAEGRGRIETYTVLYERDGTPSRGIVLGRFQDGRRFLANTPSDRDLLEELIHQEAVGRSGTVRARVPVNRFHLD